MKSYARINLKDSEKKKFISAALYLTLPLGRNRDFLNRPKDAEKLWKSGPDPEKGVIFSF